MNDDDNNNDGIGGSAPSAPNSSSNNSNNSNNNNSNNNNNNNNTGSSVAVPSSKRRRVVADDDDDDDDDDDATMVDVDANPDPDDGGGYEEEEEEGEDLLENAMRDYARIDALDTYGTEGIDDRHYDDMNVDARREADDELDRRDGRSSSRRDFWAGGLELEEEDAEDEDARGRRRGRFDRVVDDDVPDDDDDDDDGEVVNLEAFDVDLREWIARDHTRREVSRRFRRFLLEFKENDPNDPGEEPLYRQRVRVMASRNATSLEMSYLHLAAREPVLAAWLERAPRDVTEVLDECATRVAVGAFPRYRALVPEETTVRVRVSDLPVVDRIRDLRNSHLGALVRVSGVVTRRTSVFPRLRAAYYDCARCGATAGPFFANDDDREGTARDDDDDGAADAPRPTTCPVCDRAGGGDGNGNGNGAENADDDRAASSTSHFKLNHQRSLYRNHQRATLQEAPGSVPPGRVPRAKEILLADDLVDAVRPGARVSLTGIYGHCYDAQLTRKSGFPVFSTRIVANHVALEDGGGGEDGASSSTSDLSEADRRTIREMARDPDIASKIVDSIAPSIKGHRHAKTAIAMALFSGVPKKVGCHRVRGDVNVLLVGDPGTAKSQLLKYAERTAPRAVFSAGKGASAVGLTASVRKDPITKRWTLEGGALVLADRGVCLIDEFDKMNEKDRTSIHEAMEQQSISVSKAGIVASLSARCAVIAAANPVGGRYDSSATLAENVELTDPILQRFDCLCVMQDVVDPVEDERLATFVTASHMRSAPTGREGGRSRFDGDDDGRRKEEGAPLPQALLRKYVRYARATCRPRLRGSVDKERIASLYAALRRESRDSGGVPVAVRHVESVVRMAEAHAKMHLRDHVRDDDVDAAVRATLTSFVAAQKFSVRRSLERGFARYLRTGTDRAHMLSHVLGEMFRNETVYRTIRARRRRAAVDHRRRDDNDDHDAIDEGTLEIALEDFESRAKERRVYHVAAFCRSREFAEAGYLLDETRGVIVRQERS